MVADRDSLADQAELFAIYRTMDRLEIAFMKDKFNDSDYEDSCRRLITKFRALSQTLGMDGARLDEFKTTFHLHKCRRANARFSVGVPATQEHGQATTSAAGGDTAAMGRIFALMEEFWFFQDKLAMDADARAQRSVDSLLPDVQVILDKMRAFHVPPDAPLRQRLLSWQTLLTGKPATFEISDDQFRQLHHDVRMSYVDFKEFCKSGFSLTAAT